MGGGGGGYYSSVSSADVQHEIEQSTEQLAQAFETELQGILDSAIPLLNDRDVENDNRFRSEVKAIISDALDSPVVNLNLGGSVSKSTYVEGISDIDALAVFRHLEAGETNPRRLLNKIARDIEAKMPDCGVTVGSVAVTIVRRDGSEFQVIPAVKDGAHLRVPSWDGGGWSKINVRTFSKALTRYNSKLQGKLVPTIKLAKQVLSHLPPSRHLSGYHIESLAIEVFKGYREERCATSKMLPYFFEKASKAVLCPIKDRSGQSVHVDEYMGAQNSVKRKEMSHLLGRIAKRMMNASAFKSRDRWKAILGNDGD